MTARVLTYTKTWHRIEAPALLMEIDSWVPRLKTESQRLRIAMANKTWSLDAHDVHLVQLGAELWRFGEKIRRGEKVEYVSVVKDVYDPLTGKRRIRTLKSFGRSSQPDASIRAEHFLASYEAAVAVRRKMGNRSLTTSEQEAVRATFGMVLGQKWTQCVIDGADEVLEDHQSSMDNFPSGEESDSSD